ncbi:hypothetical protein Tco_0853636 [Tanacetum coccineum]
MQDMLPGVLSIVLILLGLTLMNSSSLPIECRMTVNSLVLHNSSGVVDVAASGDWSSGFCSCKYEDNADKPTENTLTGSVPGQDEASRKIPIQRPEASASPLRSIPADAYSLSELQAEAISPLMNVLQSRVSLAEEYWYKQIPTIELNFQHGCGESASSTREEYPMHFLDRENTRFKTGGPDTIQERGVFEAPLTAGSEISEVDEQAWFPVGKVGLPLVPSAAQMRSLRKGSNDQLAITIDLESYRLLDKGASVEDKGHMFKSLNTSGLVPVQGKMVADRLDGIWVDLKISLLVCVTPRQGGITRRDR